MVVLIFVWGCFLFCMYMFGYVLSETGEDSTFLQSDNADLLSESVTSSTASMATTTTNNSGDFDSTTVSVGESSNDSYPGVKPTLVVVKNSAPRPFTLHRAVEVKPIKPIVVTAPTKENINPLDTSMRFQNPIKSITKGRLLLLDIERSLKDEIEQIKHDVNDSKTQREDRSFKHRQEDSNSDLQVRRDMYKYRHGSMGYVSKLDDPTKPSLTQSKTFQLLKETLDNNLALKETRIHNSIANKTFVKRCTLNTQSTVSEPMVIYQVAREEKNHHHNPELDHIAHIDDDVEDENNVLVHENGSPVPVRRGSYSMAVTNNSHLNNHKLY